MIKKTRGGSKMWATIKKLREKDPKKWTYVALANKFNVCLTTVYFSINNKRRLAYNKAQAARKRALYRTSRAYRKKTIAYNTAYHKRRYRADPIYRERVKAHYRKWLKKRLQNPAYRKARNAKVAARLRTRYNTDAVYRKRVQAYQRSYRRRINKAAKLWAKEQQKTK